MTRALADSRTHARLQGVHPTLQQAVARILRTMQAWGTPMIVIAGVRSVEEQQKLYAQGRTTGGKVVTNADGLEKRSNHQRHMDGYGHAVDCAFLVEKKMPSGQMDYTIVWDGPWELYGQLAVHAGLVWGGHWKTIVDKPHIELP